jgi:dihydroneopterin aldolase
MTDRIRLQGIEVFAHHGVFDHEKEDGQTFIIDADIGIDLSDAASSDDLDTTLHYGELAQAIHDRVAGERWNLIERVAGRIADLLLQDARVQWVDVTVHKPEAPIGVPFSDVAVTISRRK